MYGSGSNQDFQLGLGMQVGNAPQPVQIPYLLNIKQVAACKHSAALNKDGLLYLWGTGTFGVLQQPQIVHVQNFVKVSVMGDQGGALDRCGNVYVWGRNEHGQLGLGDTADRSKPDLVAALKGYIVSDIRMSDAFCFAFSRQKREKEECIAAKVHDKMVSNPLTVSHPLLTS